MNYSDFFVLSDKDIRGTYHAIGKDVINSIAYFKGEILEGEPLSFGYRSLGKNIHDYVGIGYAALYLLSEKVINLLKENNITGWKIYPCTLYDKRKKEVNGYSLFSVTGKCGPIVDSKSEILVKQLVPNGKPCKIYKGLYFDLDIWDGSDIFSLEGTTFTIVTEKVRSLLLNNSVTNITLTCIADIKRIIIEEVPPKLQVRYKDVAADFFSEH